MVRVVSNVVSNQSVYVYPYDASEWYGYDPLPEEKVVVEESEEEKVWIPGRVLIGKEI